MFYRFLLLLIRIMDMSLILLQYLELTNFAGFHGAELEDCQTWGMHSTQAKKLVCDKSDIKQINVNLH